MGTASLLLRLAAARALLAGAARVLDASAEESGSNSPDPHALLLAGHASHQAAEGLSGAIHEHGARGSLPGHEALALVRVQSTAVHLLLQAAAQSGRRLLRDARAAGLPGAWPVDQVRESAGRNNSRNSA